MSAMTELFDRIASESSTTAKQAILAANADNPIFTDILLYAYTPEWTFGVKDVPAPATYGEGTIEGMWGAIKDELGLLATRLATGHLALEMCTMRASLLKKEDAALFFNILKRDLRCGINVGLINKAIPKAIHETPYMRCSLREKSNIKSFNWKAGVYSQEKADGMFVNVSVDGDNPFIKTRNGQRLLISRMGVLGSEIDAVLDRSKVYHGELIVKRGDEVLPREVGNGLLNSVLKGGEFPDDCEPHFYVWDAVDKNKWEEGKDTTPYKDRLKVVANLKGTYIHPIETRVVHSEKEALDHYADMLAQGKEGTVIKNPTSIWKDGTSKDQVKVKVEAEVDLEVFGYVEGKGKNEKTFGSLSCRSSDGQVVVNVSGFTDSMRQAIWDNIEEWTSGKIVTVKANNLIEDMNGRFSLFLPRFVEERLDKTEADDLTKITQIFKESF